MAAGVSPHPAKSGRRGGNGVAAMMEKSGVISREVTLNNWRREGVGKMACHSMTVGAA
jgi:hypothetical protein